MGISQVNGNEHGRIRRAIEAALSPWQILADAEFDEPDKGALKSCRLDMGQCRKNFMDARLRVGFQVTDKEWQFFQFHKGAGINQARFQLDPGKRLFPIEPAQLDSAIHFQGGCSE